MENFPPKARTLVAEMSAAAAAEPARTVAFQGAPGANSHLAVSEHFADPLPLPCFAFEDALDAVASGQAAFAMIPIENSLHGRVADIHFLLPESGLSIVAEHFLPIRHCLLGFAGEPVREAISHPQALGQCRRWLREREITPVQFADTAAAAGKIADGKHPGVAAIAPKIAAGLYGLDVIAEDISDSDDNTTRFVVLAREALTPPIGQPSMTTLTFEVKNVPAALYKAMGGFATNGVNVTKLESYQRGTSFAATEFYADIEGDPAQANVARALEELAFHTKWVRVIGSYQQARPRTVV
ncbi:prephenate dehydratase [Sphingomonas sp. ID0503]|uniref:prephenate dehydratase n=1 Tax=Sphingomonas sp. ID0503 TaxID=3399691 RepID=UPI003AFB69E7